MALAFSLQTIVSSGKRSSSIGVQPGVILLDVVDHEVVGRRQLVELAPAAWRTAPGRRCR